MNHVEFKAARHALGLSLAQLAVLLDSDPKSLRCIEMEPHHNSHRKVAPRMARLIRAYLDGYRPADWPAN